MTDRNDIMASMPAADYETLVGRIDNLWSTARNRAVEAVNTELLDANWKQDNILLNLSNKVKYVPSMAHNS